ncbi:unnamed protein product, partial [Mesorhabditis spiculigera]
MFVLWPLLCLALVFGDDQSAIPCDSQFPYYSGEYCYSKLPGSSPVNDLWVCEGYHSLPAIVTNAFDNAFLAKLLNGNSTWLGMLWNGTHVLPAGPGDVINYARWGPGQPKGNGTIVMGPDGYWHVLAKDERYSPYFCQHKAIEDCQGWRLERFHEDSGVMTVKVGNGVRQVYCDMTTQDGGWTLLQSRVDAKEPFWNRKWADYKQGFGTADPASNYWLGNEAAHVMTNLGSDTELLVEMWNDRQPGSNRTTAYWWAGYTNFSIDAESTSYTLYAWQDWRDILGNASANWYDLTYSSGRPFSTIDRINDPQAKSVSDFHLGGWWLYYGAFCSLNGEYVPPISWGNGYGMFWLVEDPKWQKGEPYQYVINPAHSKMMFRRVVKNGRMLATNRIQRVY